MDLRDLKWIIGLVSEMNEKNPSVLRYWAAGILFLIVGSIALFPITFFGQGFLGFFSYSYPNNVVIPLAYAVFTIIATPYIIGRVVKWVSEKILQRT
jgi:hypothetical protein